MILGPLNKELTPLLTAAKPIQPVTAYKLLSVTNNATLQWDDYVKAMSSKAAKRLWFLKELQGCAAADRPARRSASGPPCYTQMLIVSVINW